MLAYLEILCYHHNVIGNATQATFGGVMNTKKEGHNQLSSSASAADMEHEISSSTASAIAAAKVIQHQQIARLIQQSLTTSVVEPCLSPLLWSESFRLRLDG